MISINYIYTVVLVGLLTSQVGLGWADVHRSAQPVVLSLPKPGEMISLSRQFKEPALKGIKVYPQNPFYFDFIFDHGDEKLDADDLKAESQRLIKYFLTSLTIPDEDLWVNLSPHEKDRIIPESFGQTEMGRDLLAEDYVLKQITASLIYPEGEFGKKFWERVRGLAEEKFGSSSHLPFNTFNKVWILPEDAQVYENAKEGIAYIVNSRLKVMLDEDYLSLRQQASLAKAQGVDSSQALGTRMIREIILPELTKEVNQNENFRKLRQVYQSYILASWYKKKLHQSLLNRVYAGKNKIDGIKIDDPQEKQKIYERYVSAFKMGVYNYVVEEVDPVTNEPIPHKYFSGGVHLAQTWNNNPIQYLSEMPPAIDSRSVLTTLGVAVTTEVSASTPARLDSPPIYAEIRAMIEPYAQQIAESLGRKQDEIAIDIKTFNKDHHADKSFPGIEVSLYFKVVETQPVDRDHVIARLRLNQDGTNLWLSGLFFRDISDPDKKVVIIQNYINFDDEVAETRASFKEFGELLGEKFGTDTMQGFLSTSISDTQLAEELANLIGERTLGRILYRTALKVQGQTEDKFMTYFQEEMGGELYQDIPAVIKLLAFASVGLTREQLKTVELSDPTNLMKVLEELRQQPRFYTPAQKYPSSKVYQKAFLEISKTLKVKALAWGFDTIQYQIAIPDGIEKVYLYSRLGYMIGTQNDFVARVLTKLIFELEKRKESGGKDTTNITEIAWKMLKIFRRQHQLVTMVLDLKSSASPRQMSSTITDVVREGLNRLEHVDDGVLPLQASTPIVNPVGGIDLNSNQLQLKIENQGEEIKISIDPDVLKQLESIPGFTPRIITATPLKDLNAFLTSTSNYTLP